MLSPHSEMAHIQRGYQGALLGPRLWDVGLVVFALLCGGDQGWNAVPLLLSGLVLL